MPKILDGKVVQAEIITDLKNKVGDFEFVPNLAIIKIGNNPDSESYIKRKIDFAKKIGVNAYIVNFPESDSLKITQAMLLAGIKKLNQDKSVSGIIIQAPLPEHLNWAEAVEAVAPEKDVDGLCSVNVKKLVDNDPTALIPATARGILSLLTYYKIPVKGKKVVVMGRSALVGKPVADLMINNGATVTVVHSQTANPDQETRQADILIVAIGKPEYVGAEFVKEGAVVVDVGISTVINSDGIFNRPRHRNDTSSSSDEGASSKPLVTVVGDVDFDSVSPIVSAISPVPGGVGPMTVASLFQNLVEAVLVTTR